MPCFGPVASPALCPQTPGAQPAVWQNHSPACLPASGHGLLVLGPPSDGDLHDSPQHTIRDYGVSWYQQRPGSAPRYLLYYHSDEEYHRPDEIPDRFSAAKDVVHNACILTISPVQPEDDADYYCAVGFSSGP
ncbi:pre-B lymphocyte protein 3 isoform X1 [Nycticebus coucang]|uniref:pre-B lymphocyte protein 3 isoform X1 n=1 Tax=Nycticebus coucang TaxID=9470 RepID=UPI00234E317A|nr:pre-B lymphocyte protein 3 isoform X1 [Nycticebus coucang]